MNKKTMLLLYLAFIFVFISGCKSSSEQYKASSYTSSQVNQRQEAKTIEIIAIMPAKVQIDNSQAKNNAQKAGSLVGAVTGAVIGDNQGEALIGGVVGAGAGVLAGSFVQGKTIVDGVTLTYSENNKVYTSSQVGLPCEFQLGTALVVSTQKNETRVQPNAQCPVEKK